MNEKPRPLALETSHDGMTLTQVERHGTFAIYQKTAKNGNPRGFELIKIKTCQEAKFPNGNTLPFREVYPGNESWGTLGWTTPDLKSAQTKLQEWQNLG